MLKRLFMADNGANDGKVYLLKDKEGNTKKVVYREDSGLTAEEFLKVAAEKFKAEMAKAKVEEVLLDDLLEPEEKTLQPEREHEPEPESESEFEEPLMDTFYEEGFVAEPAREPQKQKPERKMTRAEILLAKSGVAPGAISKRRKGDDVARVAADAKLVKKYSGKLLAKEQGIERYIPKSVLRDS